MTELARRLGTGDAIAIGLGSSVVVGFSSFGVLLYYAIANIAAFTQSGEQRRYPRALQLLGLLGLLGCVVLALTLPWQSAAAGAAVVALGCAGRAVRLQR